MLTAEYKGFRNLDHPPRGSFSNSTSHIMEQPLISQKSPLVQKAEPGSYWWCACGRSKSQPFCDGSHGGTGIEPRQVEITEAKQVAWCMCKHSGQGAFCDGSHKKV